MTTIAIVYHSGYGHTKLQAEAVLKGAAGIGGVTAKIYTVDEATTKLDELDEADAIIFGCPTYMGSVSAGMKTFMEAAAPKWFGGNWKDKVAGAFTNSSSFSGDKFNTLVDLMTFAMQHSMIYVGLGLMPSANAPESMNSIEGPGPEAHNRVGSFIGPMASSFQVNPGDAPSKGDLETAELYGKRIASVTLQIVAGRGA